MALTGYLTTALGTIGRGLSAAGEALQSRASGPDPQRDPTLKRDMDDTTVTRKVESVVSRLDGYDKSKIDLDTVDGVVHLRGEAKRPELIKGIEAAVRAIPEVRDVENLLHLPKTKAPTRADAPGSAKRKAATRKTAADAPTKVAGRFERKPDVAEPPPDELAAARKGRQAAPLGAKDTGKS